MSNLLFKRPHMPHTASDSMLIISAQSKLSKMPSELKSHLKASAKFLADTSWKRKFRTLVEQLSFC